MAAVAISYPAILTERDWQKHKGLIARIAIGKTDLGKLLSATESAFDRSGLGREPASLDRLEPEDFLRRRTEIVGHIRKGCDLVSKAAQNAKDRSASLQSDLKKNKMAPASVSAHVNRIESELRKFILILSMQPDLVEKSLTADFRTDAAIGEIFNLAKKIPDTWGRAMNAIATVQKNPSLKTAGQFYKSESNLTRTLVTNFKYWDKVVAVRFKKTATRIYSGTALSDYADETLMAAASGKLLTDMKLEISRPGKSEATIVNSAMEKLYTSTRRAKPMVEHYRKLASAYKAALQEI